jgi:glycosyltransferase involved in cell wall biosynthesis
MVPVSHNRTDLTGLKVLVISSERIAERMAGPAIRALNLALQLADRGARVTLAVSAAQPGLAEQLPGISLTTFGKPSARGFRSLATGQHVVVTQPQRVDVGWGLRGSGARIIYDLYVPTFVETIAHLGAEAGDRRVLAQRLEVNRLEYSSALQLGDAFICASDRQRDLWLGALGEAGRLDLALIRRDPQTDQLIGVVPFGVSDSPPPPLAGSGPIHGELVPADSTALLWTGGLWNWFDPVSVVEGLAQARIDDPRLQLVVMGMRHPDPSWEEQAASTALRRRAGELGLLAPGGGVVLLEGWVPYRDRHRYLLDADAAVSSHFDTVETRFSFRTRFLDHLWCGLPTLTTPGGELAERMIAAGAAEPVAEGDSQAWARALRSIAHDPDRLARMGAAAATLADDYRWSIVTEPLARIVAQQGSPGVARTTSAPRPNRLDAARYALLMSRLRVQEQGVGSIASGLRRAARKDVG